VLTKERRTGRRESIGHRGRIAPPVASVGAVSRGGGIGRRGIGRRGVDVAG
jgi:hypothetical protein